MPKATKAALRSSVTGWSWKCRSPALCRSWTMVALREAGTHHDVANEVGNKQGGELVYLGNVTEHGFSVVELVQYVLQKRSSMVASLRSVSSHSSSSSLSGIMPPPA